MRLSNEFYRNNAIFDVVFFLNCLYWIYYSFNYANINTTIFKWLTCHFSEVYFCHPNAFHNKCQYYIKNKGNCKTYNSHFIPHIFPSNDQTVLLLFWSSFVAWEELQDAGLQYFAPLAHSVPSKSDQRLLLYWDDKSAWWSKEYIASSSDHIQDLDSLPLF